MDEMREALFDHMKDKNDETLHSMDQLISDMEQLPFEQRRSPQFRERFLKLILGKIPRKG